MRKRDELPALHGLRGIAALSIAVTHFAVVMKLKVFGYPLNVAPIGMPLFFTLSGFIVHYVYAAGLSANYAQDVKMFAVARFARLYPLFAVMFAFYAVFGFGDFAMTLLRNPAILASYLTLTGSWWFWKLDGVPLPDTAYGVSWSIATEAFFYVAYAAGLYLISAIRSPRACAGALIALCMGAFALLLSSYLYALNIATDFGDPLVGWLFYISPYFHLMEFVGGCLASAMHVVVENPARRWIRGRRPTAAPAPPTITTSA